MVLAGLSLPLVYLNLFTISIISLLVLFLSLNNNLLTVVVLKVLVVKVAMVLGQLMLFLTLNNTVLFKKTNTNTLLKMEHAKLNFKELDLSLLNNSKLMLLMLLFKLLSKILPSLFALMLQNGVVIVVVFSLNQIVVVILTLLIMLSYLLVSMPTKLGRSETLGVLAGVKVVTLPSLLVTLVVLKIMLFMLLFEKSF